MNQQSTPPPPPQARGALPYLAWTCTCRLTVCGLAIEAEMVIYEERRPWDKLIESGRLQGILAKGLAFVVYTTFRWNNFNWDLFLLICSLDVNEPCPMLWYKPKFTQGVSPFIHQVLTTWSLLSRTYYSLLLLCTLGFNSSQFNFIHTLNWIGQRYDQLLLGKSWPCFLFFFS